jgi:hypothetical protein
MNHAATRPAPSPSPRLNTWLSWLTAAAAILTLALSALALIPAFIDADLTELAAAAGATDVTILWPTRIIVFLIYLAHSSVLAYAFFAAAGLFRLFATGRAFSPETGRLLRGTGFALLAHLLLRLPVHTAVILATTWLGPGETMISVGVGLTSEGAFVVMMAALLIALGHVLHEAARLAEDHRQIV